MKRREFIAYFGVVALAGPSAAVGQGIPRVGLLMGSNPSVEAATLDAFRGALAKLDYVDGQTVVIEIRYAMGQSDRFGSLARELVALAHSVIACVGSKETVALQAATRTIPIVFIQAPNPVELGLVMVEIHRPREGASAGWQQIFSLAWNPVSGASDWI